MLIRMTMLSRSLALLVLVALHPLAAQSVKLVTVTLTAPTLALGGRTTAVARVRLANGQYSTTKPIAWGTSKPGVALVSDKGVVSTIAAGSTTIFATVSGVTGQGVLTVLPGVPPPPPPAAVASVAVSLAAPSIPRGTITQATALARDSSGDVLTGRAVTWLSVAPSIASVSSTGSVSGLATGTSAIRATVEGKVANATVTVTADTVTPPPADTSSTIELPRVYLTTTVASTPSTGRTLAVHAGGNLQAALDSARFGDKILVDSCATFRGNYTFGIPKAGNAGEYVTVQKTGRLPAEGTRARPDSAAAMCYPKIIGQGSINTLITRPSANHWRFIGLEITVDSANYYSQAAVLVGDGSVAQNTLSIVPSDIIFDRVYVHGAPNVAMRVCVVLDAARTSVIDSYLSDCHSTFDAQAIAGTNGPGPFKIVNNYLEASGENINWGGADPGIPGLVPADIEIRRNHIYKPLAWQSTQWTEKNLIESKNSTRVLVEGNVLENTWANGQVGYTLALWSVNQTGRCPWCVTSHWTFRNNVIKNVSAGINLSSAFVLPGYGFPMPIPMHHIAITNNVWLGLTGNTVFQLDSIPFTTIEHNTAMNPGGQAFVFSAQASVAALVVRNNLLSGYYGITAWWGGNGAAIAAVGAGAGSDWTKNVVQTQFGWNNPPTNYAPVTEAEIGFVGGSPTLNIAAWLDQLVLAGGSPFKGLATDSTDIGANIAVVKAAIAGVVIP